MKEDLAWKVYNFINEWKSGSYGPISLQEALDRHFNDVEVKNDEKFVMDSRPISTSRRCKFFYSTGPNTYGCWRGVFPLDCEDCDKAEWSSVEIKEINRTDNI